MSDDERERDVTPRQRDSPEGATPTREPATATPGDPNLPCYVARAPERRQWDWNTLRRVARIALQRSFHLFKHALSTFEERPTHPHPISMSSPAGVFTAEWLPAAQEIERKAEVRHEKLEQKATVMLSVLAFLAPIIVSAIVYIVSNPPLQGRVHLLATVLGIAAMASVLLAFVAALRTLAVRGHQEILVGGLVKDRRVREYNADFRIRGMLWAAANREAINDHIADFARASQMFLGVGITMVSVMGAAVLLFAGKPGPQIVQGTVALDHATVEAAGAAVAKSVQPLVRRIEEVRERLDSLPPASDFDSLAAEVERLQAEVATLRGGGRNR